MTSYPTKDSTYEVALRGELGPALLAGFASLGVGHAATSSVFLLAVPLGQGLCEVAAMLQARGLRILDIRQVSVSPPDTVTAPAAGLTRRG